MTTWSFPSRLTLAVAAGSLAALGVAACSSGSAGSGSAGSLAGTPSSAPAAAGAQATVQAGGASTVHACALLTAAKASAVVGVHYSSATESGAGDMCSYATTDAPIPLFIIITPRSSGTAAWNSELSTMEEDAGSPPVKLSGAGDRAAGGGTEIGVQDGSYIIDVHGGDPLGTGGAFPKSIGLANVIIAGLK
jgi:hypothetical protein